MQIQYRYQDKLFDDIRDIVHNNKLKIDYDTLFTEYLPFQIFISGKTLFKGLTIEPTVRYDYTAQKPAWPSSIPERLMTFDILFSKSIQTYLLDHGYYNHTKTAATVSGGIDSSVVALEVKPRHCYSGYYEGNGDCNETDRAKEVVSRICDSVYTPIRLTEADFFLTNLEEYMDTVCSPVGGIGGVMELACLKKAKAEYDMDGVLFGNGGDELFMGYYWNHFIREFYENTDDANSLRYMRNFWPTKNRLVGKAIDYLIELSLNRWNGNYAMLGTHLFGELHTIRNPLNKLLHVNINYTLPSLLHINNQICKSVKVKGYNPLANKDLIRMAYWFNDIRGARPKNLLRTVREDLPDSIKCSEKKLGFQIPLETWDDLNEFMHAHHHAFFKRKNVRLMVDKYAYNGITRQSWGVLMAELFLRRWDK